jgi:hypothetical protein
VILLVTGPVARFARQIAGQGYIVAAPSSYHEFTGPEPLAYDVPGTDAGNEYKIKKVSNLKLELFSHYISSNIMFRHLPDTTKTRLLLSPIYSLFRHAMAASEQQECV